MFHILPEVLEVFVFNLGLHAPVIRTMFLPCDFHVSLELFPLILKVKLNFTRDSDPHTELRIWCENRIRHGGCGRSKLPQHWLL